MIVDPVIVERDYSAGATGPRIAARFGVTRQAVERWARTLGLPKRYPKNQQKGPAMGISELSPLQRALLDIATGMGADGIGLHGAQWHTARALVRSGLARIEGAPLSAGGKRGRLVSLVEVPAAHRAGECAARGCAVRLAPRKFFCLEHWGRLPAKIRSQLSHAARGRASPVLDDIVAWAAASLGGAK